MPGIITSVSSAAQGYPGLVIGNAVGGLTAQTTEARALLHHLLEHADVVGRDTAGQTIIQLSVPDHVLETLMTFDAEAAELEDGGDDEPDADEEEDGPPALIELVPPRTVERRRAVSACVD